MLKTPCPVSPLGWVPSLYFAMGLPFVVLNMVSAVMFKDLGIPDAQIAFWTSLIMWPWTIKFLWSPFLEIFRTKKFFVVSTQLVSGVMFGLAALALHLPSFFAVTVAVFAVIAFSGATHDIAADGVYMSELSQADQAKYIGWQGAFYNLAKLVATGGLVWFAGWLYERFDDGRMAAFDAFVQSWTVVLAILCALMVLLGLYHARRLPSGGASAGGHHTLPRGMDGLREVIAAFFKKKAHRTLYPLHHPLPPGRGVRDEDRAAVPQGRRLGRGASASPTSRSDSTTARSVPGPSCSGRCWRATTSPPAACGGRSLRWSASSTSRSWSTPCWPPSSPSRCGSSAAGSCWSISVTDSGSSA